MIEMTNAIILSMESGFKYGWQMCHGNRSLAKVQRGLLA